MSEKVIGILGGMGPEATIDLFYKIIKSTPAEKDQDHYCSSESEVIVWIGVSPVYI